MKNKFDQWLLLFLKWASPIAITAAVLSVLGMSKNSLLMDILGITTILWIIIVIYQVFTIGLSDSKRNQFVRWLAGIKENDERESLIAGVVSKKTFIFMTGVLTLLLFLSMLRISIYQTNEIMPNGKKNGEVSLGFASQFIQTDLEQKTVQEGSQKIHIVRYNGLPLTADGVLIIVMLLQIGAFYTFSRRENKAL